MGFLTLGSQCLREKEKKKCYVHILLWVIEIVAILYCWDDNDCGSGMNMDTFLDTITFCCDKQTVP